MVPKDIIKGNGVLDVPGAAARCTGLRSKALASCLGRSMSGGFVSGKVCLSYFASPLFNA